MSVLIPAQVHIASLKYGAGAIPDFIKDVGHPLDAPRVQQGPGPLEKYSLILGTDVVYSDEVILAFKTLYASILLYYIRWI